MPGTDLLNCGMSGSHSLACFRCWTCGPMDPVLYQRCLTAVWRSRKSAISRTDLQQAVGLGFQADTVDFDLLLAQLVGEEILEPTPLGTRKFTW
jgi:hypothetical protein